VLLTILNSIAVSRKANRRLEATKRPAPPCRVRYDTLGLLNIKRVH